MKKLYRVERGKVIAGVALGLAEYFNVDVTLVRLILAVLIPSGLGPLIYIAGWLLMPVKTK